MTGLRPETLLAQAAGADDPTTGGVVPPLQPSTTFLRDPDNAYRRGFDYACDRNPTLAPAEAVLAALEGGAEALLFASGMAAATAVFQALRPGGHAVAPRVLYWGLRKWLLETATAWGLEVELVDTTEPEAVRAALRPGRTRLLWLETPANPTWAVSDVAALAGLARAAGCPRRRRQHGADAAAHPAAGARRRPRHALGDQVPERPQRRGRGCLSRQARRRGALADALDICRTEPPRPTLPLSSAIHQRVAAALAKLATDDR